MRYLLTIIFATAALCNLSAQPDTLSLRECLERGLENNYEILIQRNNERISDNNATRAAAGMMPTLDLTAGYSGIADKTISKPIEGDKITDNATYNQSLDVGLSLNWTIFDGFRLSTNYAKLREMQQVGNLQTRMAIEDLVANLTAEYYNLIQQKLRKRNYRYAVALSRERLRISEARFQLGTFSRLDVLQARVDFNADSSKYMLQQELVTASQIRINKLMANPNINERCTARERNIIVNDSLKWDDLVQQTTETNVSLLIADRSTAISELDLKAVKSRNYPYLNLVAGYGYTHNHFGSGEFKTRGTIGPNVGLKLGFNIFDGNKRREQRNAAIDVENARLTRAQIEQALMADLANFWQAYQNNLEVIKLETQNLIAAKENYEIALERYLLGTLSGVDMRDAQINLLDAEERILTAKYNTKLCEISLMQISGNILSYLNQ